MKKIINHAMHKHSNISYVSIWCRFQQDMNISLINIKQFFFILLKYKKGVLTYWNNKWYFHESPSAECYESLLEVMRSFVREYQYCLVLWCLLTIVYSNKPFFTFWQLFSAMEKCANQFLSFETMRIYSINWI